ncbi:uromodulin [Pogona vitticeps]
MQRLWINRFLFLLLATEYCSDCHPNATCKEHGGLRHCVCQDGFTGDGTNCSDIDECSSRDLNRCHPLAKCINHGGSYSCLCPEGYEGDGYHCRAVSSFAEGCAQASGSRNCSDPCVTHTVLDQPWRSTSYRSGSNCDQDKIGWFQFVGSGGRRMPETCVPVSKCNTVASMWLNGTHPTRDNEIVRRTACADWGGNCCYWSITVEVKACPGGYYVYNFDGTPACTLGYCTDPNFTENPCPPCKREEECRLVDGKWSCYNSQEPDISSLEPQLECGAKEIKVSIEKDVLSELGFPSVIMYLKDYRCSGFEEEENKTMISVVTPAQAGRCGTQLTKNETHATYSNTLYLADKTIIRENEIKINFHCSYPLDMEISLETAIQPIVSSINISIGGAGEFIIKMALYRDSNYTSPYEGFKAILSTEDYLYVGVMIASGDTAQFVLRMENCFATPTESASDPLKYYIIQNSCPNTQDSTITVPENGVGSQGMFSLQVFKFVGNHNLVHLHCEIRLCDNSTEGCRPSCSGVGNRRAAGTGYSLHVGPIAREGFETFLVAAAPASHGLQDMWKIMLVPVLMGLFLRPLA